MIIQSTNEIFAELLLYKQTLSPLLDLVTTIEDAEDLATELELLGDSQAAEWVLMLYNTAFHSRNVQVGMQSAIDEIVAILKTQRIPDAHWFIEKMLAYQDGDNVIIADAQPTYQIIDTAKQIIGSCTVSLRENTVYLKLRRIDSELFSVDELNRINNYVKQIQYFGAKTIIENYQPDLLTITMEVIYNGTYSVDVIKTSVETAINDYINNIEFDSYINVNKLLDSIQAIDGVIDPRLDEISVIDALNVTKTFRFDYKTTAGYAAINPDTLLDDIIPGSNPSRTYIKYTPVI